MYTKRKLQRITTRIKRSHERIDKMRSDRLKMPFAHFVALMPYMTTDTIKSLVLIPPPHTMHRVAVPQDLQGATFGMLVQLQRTPTDDHDYLRTCCKLVSVLTGINEQRVASSQALQVLGIVNMVQSEMERIGKLFQALNTEHTSEEMSAGIDRLNFGAFGIVDWYAQRMGIVDHEEVFRTPWARIYQCMKIDHENNEFEKRMRKVIEHRSKRK